jgi:hypothetical protein
MARAALLALLAALACPAAAAAQERPGPRHACPEHWSGLAGGETEIAYRISEIWDPFHAPMIERAGAVVFTDRPGTFLNINCTDGIATPTERQEFYPIGMILKPLRVLTLSDDETDRVRNPLTGVELEVPRTYLLVLTEFGHLKVVRERDVQDMISGATYFFAEGNNHVYLCDEAGDCPGNQRVAHRPDGTSAPVCDRERCRESTAIAPLGGYAVGGVEHVVGGAPGTDWSRVEAARRLLRMHGADGVDRAVIDDYCRPFRVKSYERGGRPRLLSSDAEFLTLCMERGVPRRPTLRDVTKEQALAIFDDLAEGIFFRRFGSRGTTLVSILNPAGGPRAEGRKECFEAISTESSSNLEVSGGWKLATGMFDFGSRAGRAVESSLRTLFSDREYVRFSNYLAPDFASEAIRPLEDHGAIYSLVFIADCNGQVVDRPKAVALDHPTFSDGRMEILAQDLTNTHARIHGSPDAPLPGYDLNRSADTIRAGQFFTIHDIDSYFLWKATVRQYLATDTSLGTLLREIEDPDRREVVLRFFPHLLMAAMFRYEIPGDARRAEPVY